MIIDNLNRQNVRLAQHIIARALTNAGIEQYETHASSKFAPVPEPLKAVSPRASVSAYWRWDGNQGEYLLSHSSATAVLNDWTRFLYVYYNCVAYRCIQIDEHEYVMDPMVTTELAGSSSPSRPDEVFWVAIAGGPPVVASFRVKLPQTVREILALSPQGLEQE